MAAVPSLSELWGSSLARARRWGRELPVTPARAGAAAVHRHVQHRHKVAASDPRWAEIEARRETGRGTKIFLSTEAGLGFPEWEEQQRIARDLVPDPRWLPLAYRVQDWTWHRVSSSVRHTSQRARRGWSDADAWDVGRRLASMTAGMLDHLAATSHSWPGECEEFSTPQEWEDLLRAHAARLRLWVSGAATSELTSLWYEAAKTSGEEDRAERLRLELDDTEDRVYRDAQESLRWVADHLATLWD